MDVCLAELVIRLPKPHEQIPTPAQKTYPTFTSEGKSNSTLKSRLVFSIFQEF